ncbi:MAG TPA: Cys-tRNA(Pro) deacylase [Bacteroidota bacterium]|nr:Cys-tRNA(Pro) deacylase [Bacteroidota bacterium]
MSKPEYPITTAIRLLREKKIEFVPYFYTYEEHGGTTVSAGALGIPEHEVVKTLVMQTDEKKPLIVLMHGDREVSTKQLARVLGVRRIDPCDEPTAQRHTGYQFGGTSPFGTRHSLPICVERTILELPRIFINGGKRGFLVEISPEDLRKAFDIRVVEVAVIPS